MNVQQRIAIDCEELEVTVTSQLGDKPTGRQRPVDWATRFGQLGDKAIINQLLTTVEMGKLYN